MNSNRLHVLFLALAMTALSARAVRGQANAPLPWSEIGAKAEAGYRSDGLAGSLTEGGARLRCVFQQLEGDATREGLWLSSPIANAMTERFRMMATEAGRVTPRAPTLADETSSVQRIARPAMTLPATGTIETMDKRVHFVRPGLIEEYSVSMHGVRQDFVVLEKPALPFDSSSGELRVQLDVTGARVETAANGVQLVLPRSGRKIAYGGLCVTDATGRELPARMEVCATTNLAVLVDDSQAVYPVRVDPTFSDANWSALGSGINDVVYALAVSGCDVYAGGHFTTAGGIAASNIAKWNGNSWSALGPEMNGHVTALAVLGSELFAGGDFTEVGTNAISGIAKWNGSSWSALGRGIGGGNLVMGTAVFALAASGSDVYVGGNFTMATNSDKVAVEVNHIAKWNGSSWSALGSGMNRYVKALAISGSDLYAAGAFQTAGDTNANFIAKWNGSSWSPLGSGMDSTVTALAVSGTDLYAGGSFTTAGGNPANRIAKWDGNSWSALGSGMVGAVGPLALSGSDLYAGGVFNFAGGKLCTNVARAFLERPTLSILRSGTNVTLFWPTFYEAFALQQNPDAANSNSWSNANYPLTTNGETKSATVSPTPTNEFFRLIGN